MNLKTPLDPLPAELLLRLIDRLPLIIWVATADLTRIIYVNPVCAQIYGCSPADLYARPSLYVDAIHPEDRQEVVDFFTAHHGREAVREYRLMRPDGSVRWVRDHTLPATQDYWCGFVEDITEPRQVATELGDQKKFLQSLLTAIIGRAHV